MDKFEIIHVMKWHYDRRKTNFLKNLKYATLHVLNSIELKEVRDILKDAGFQIPENTLYQFGNIFSYTFTFTKKYFLLENTDHLNFKFKINAKNLSKEKKEIFESSNSIYDSQYEVAAPKDIKTILGGEGEKLKKLVKDIDLTIISLYETFFLYDLEKLYMQNLRNRN